MSQAKINIEQEEIVEGEGSTRRALDHRGATDERATMRNLRRDRLAALHLSRSLAMPAVVL